MQVSLGESDVARTPQVSDVDPLRDGPLNARARRILRLKGVGRLALACCLKRVVVLVCADHQGARLRGCLRAAGANRAGLTIRPREADVDDGVPVAVVALPPLGAAVPLGAGRLARLPIDPEAGGVETLPCLGLPTRVGRHRADEIDAIDSHGPPGSSPRDRPS